jgi:uncharacterized protein
MDDNQFPFQPENDAPRMEPQIHDNQPFEPVQHPVPVSFVLGIFVLFSLLGTMVGGGLTLLLGYFYGLDTSEVAAAIGPDAPPNERGLVRWMLILSHLGTFVVPGLLTVVLFYGRKMGASGPLAAFASNLNWLDYLRAGRWPGWLQVGLGLLLLLAALPLVHYLYGVNKLLPLPEWMRAMESQTNDAIRGVLRMDSPGELAANLIIMALVPAIGEELVFRGILQQQLMRKIANPWVGILLAGAIFSAIHLQFEGFLPRWLLGVLLGWMFWRTQNFWVPVAAHFFNNAFQVVGAYLFQEKLTEIDFEQDVEVPALVADVSVFLIWAVMRQLGKIERE